MGLPRLLGQGCSQAATATWLRAGKHAGRLGVLSQVRILAISDLRVHGIAAVERIAERVQPDLLLYAGDDVGRFRAGPNSWSPLAQRTRFGLAGVLGNDCDPADAVAFEQPGCHNLHRSPLLLGGLAFLGLQGAPCDDASPMGYNLYTRREAREHLRAQLAQALDRPSVLVSHAPPRGVLDDGIRFGSDSLGSSEVRKFISKKDVRAVVCGHVHLQGGRLQHVGHCAVANVASHDDVGARIRYAILDWANGGLNVSVRSEKDAPWLGALPGVGTQRATRLQRRGFTSVEDVLAADDRALAKICCKPHVAQRLRARARAAQLGQPVVLDAGAQLPSKAVVVDVETSLAQNDPWLIGFKALGNSNVRQLIELAPRRHRAHLLRLSEQFERRPDSTFIHWGAFDRAALRRAYLQARLALPPWLEDASRWLNLQTWVEHAVALPLPDYKLKTVAALFGYHFKHKDVDGLLVGSWYSRFRRNGAPFNVSMVRSYNRDDVHSLEVIARGVSAILDAKSPLIEPKVGAAAFRKQRAA